MTRKLTLAAILGTLAACASVGLLATSAWLISRSAQRPLILALMAPAAVVQAFGMARAGLRYAERLAGHDAALRKLASIRTGLYSSLIPLAPAALPEYRSGDLLSRLVTDIDSLADRWLKVRLPYAAALVAGAAAVALVAALVPAAGIVLAATLAAAALAAPAIALATARRAERAIVPLRADLAAATMDLVDGAAELAVFGAGERVLAGVARKEAKVAEATIRSGYGKAAGSATSALAAGAAAWGCLALGALAVSRGALPGVLLAVVVLTPLAVHEVFAALAPAAQETPRLRAAAARVSSLRRRPAPVVEPESGAPLPLPPPPYDLVIEGLSARWPGGPAVFEDLSFSVPAGTRTVLTGPSGSGKTTLAMVLLRFTEPAAGRVLLNGTDLAALPGDAVRSVIGLCAQDAHVFDSTIEANLRLARPEASQAELRSALARARLLDWTDSLPRGLSTPVGEHGAKLSGGQRQRLALARVLLAGFPVVILDEPAEHLDERTAAELTADLLTATAGRTVLLITHRPVDGTDQEATVSMCAHAER
ncbi:MAG: thiol reductant ABC exporter subunit CydC [Streptosporangiales bacterium]|nr:thiol reductant ABC exporter subunit CydC [Streptosporangiales bacterium]